MRRLWLSLLMLLACGLVAAGWYAYDRGFTRKWRGYVAAEFRKRGVELRVSKMTLDPFRGIIARNVKVFDARDRRRVLAGIDEMRLVINWANLASGKTFLDALELTDATLSLPLDPENPRGEKVEVTGLSGRLFLPPQQVYLSRLEAELYGVHVTASGRLINPQKLSAADVDSARWSSATDVAAVVLGQWRRLKFAGRPAELEVRFSGDLAAPEKLIAELSFWAEQIAWKGASFEKLYAAATVRDGRLELKQLTMNDAAGTLQLSGEWDLQRRTASTSVRSNLDITPLVRAFDHATVFEALVLHGAPVINGTARAAFNGGAKFQLIGHIAAPRFSYRGEEFLEGAADFSWDGARWSARDTRIVHRTGVLTGDILHLPGEARTRLKNSIDPDVLRPLFSGAAGDWLREGEGS